MVYSPSNNGNNNNPLNQECLHRNQAIYELISLLDARRRRCITYVILNWYNEARNTSNITVNLNIWRELIKYIHIVLIKSSRYQTCTMLDNGTPARHAFVITNPLSALRTLYTLLIYNGANFIKGLPIIVSEQRYNGN